MKQSDITAESWLKAWRNLQRELKGHIKRLESQGNKQGASDVRFYAQALNELMDMAKDIEEQQR